MADDWIKIRTDLYEDQDVLQMSDILGTDDATTVGLLVRFWSWADKQTIDGSGIRITKTRVDALTGRPGFAASLIQVGWLEGEDGNLQLPNFQRHNGASAKARALESEAKRLRRSEQKTSDRLSDKCPTKTIQNVRPEKRREENIIPPTPKGGIGQAQDFFQPASEPAESTKRLRRLTQAQKQRLKHPIITPAMQRIGSWFNRQPETKWSIAEFEALQDANPTDKEIAGMETYYLAEIPTDKDHRRTALVTLLNNWSTDLDRARRHYRETISQAS